MKHILLAAVLLPVMLRAQVPQPVSQRVLPSSFQPSATNLPDNYQVTLNITDKDGQQPLEVSVVVASSQFSAQLAEQSLSFSGNMSVEESGGITIGYTLGWQTPVTANNGSSFQYLPSNTLGSVRLKLGEEVQIIKAGTRTARLSVKKLEASKAK